MVESIPGYEECRRQRLEENKKRMEELNLKKLSLDLKKTQSAPKPSPAKPRTPRQRVDLTAVRRSVRVSGKPTPNYKEAAIEPLKMPRRSYSYQRRDLLNRIYASDEERHHAIDQAEKLQSSLDAEFPSFVKPMLQSHVTGGFWLGLPLHFCKSYLPHRDEYLTLVDEDGNESQTKYLAGKSGLSGGWRGFAIDHELVDGDALVFQLTERTEFKVYIIRAYDSEDKKDADNNEDEDSEEDKDLKEEDEDIKPLGRRSKRIKNNNEDEDTERDKDHKEEDEDIKTLGRRSKRIKEEDKEQGKDHKEEDEDIKPLGRRSKRIQSKK